MYSHDSNVHQCKRTKLFIRYNVQNRKADKNASPEKLNDKQEKCKPKWNANVNKVFCFWAVLFRFSLFLFCFSFSRMLELSGFTFHLCGLTCWLVLGLGFMTSERGKPIRMWMRMWMWMWWWLNRSKAFHVRALLCIRLCATKNPKQQKTRKKERSACFPLEWEIVGVEG